MLYDDRGSLGSLLEIVVDNYEQEREEYWTDDEVGTAALEFIDSVARTLLDASHDFAAKQLVLDDVPFKYSQVQFLSNIEGIRERVHERLQIESTMRTRLNSAVRFRLISDEANKAAWTVW